MVKKSVLRDVFARGRSVAVGATGLALASQAFAFETGLGTAQDSVETIIGIGVGIVVAIALFVIGQRVVSRIRG